MTPRNLLTLVFVVPVVSPLAQPAVPAVTDREAYAVYAAAMRPFDRDIARPPAIAVQIETLPGPSECPREPQITDEWREAAADYRRQNETTKFIRPGFDLGAAYSLIPAFEVVRLLKADGLLGPDGYRSPDAPQTNHPGWRVFSQFPGGQLVALSAIGFNLQRTRAVVAVQHDCIVLPNGHSYCHGYDVTGFQKTNGRWEPATSIGCHGAA